MGTTSYYLVPKLQSNSTDVDVIGYSYYPKWHYDPNTGSGDMDDVQTNLNNTVSTYGKPVAIVETGFPSWGAQWEPEYEFEVSEAGQELFLQSLVETVQNVPNDQGLGVFWWYPEAAALNTQVNGEWVYEGGRYGLFDDTHDAVPALDVFEQFLTTGILGDYNGNNVVDAADYTTWRNALTAGISTLLNDPTPGSVTESDLTYWRANFGETLGSGAGAAATTVPEPSSLLLACFGGLIMARVLSLHKRDKQR